MDVKLEVLSDREKALVCASELDRVANEVVAEFRDEPLAEGVVARMLDRHFGAPECVFVLATRKEDGERLGVCVSAPLEDPLTGERLPLVVLLHVAPQSRHRGLARQLVDALGRELRGRGLHKIAARAGHNDDALISMGERWGFVRHFELMLLE